MKDEVVVSEHLTDDVKRLMKEGKKRVVSDDYESLLGHKKPLTDDSFMPFGKHANKKMEYVPALYLCKLWKKCKNESSAITDYIRNNLTILRLEYPNGDWSE